MIATFGYRDAEGEFYLTIDQNRCASCGGKPCVGACPASVLVEEQDPYGESVAAVDDRKRRKLKYECMACKPRAERPPLPCAAACPAGAIGHSW